MRKLLLLIVVVFALLGSAPAHAQTTTTEYPGTTTPPQATTRTIDLGTLAPGERASAEDCLFAPGTTITVVLNGAPIGTTTADQNGCVRVTVENINGGTISLGRPAFAVAGLQVAQAGTDRVRITVNDLSREVNARRGENLLTLSGTGSNGAPRLVRIFFTLPGPADAAADRGAAGRAAGGGGGALSRTGGMIMRWSLAGVALAGIGALLVVADRRRSRRPETTT